MGGDRAAMNGGCKGVWVERKTMKKWCETINILFLTLKMWRFEGINGNFLMVDVRAKWQWT